MTNSDPFAPGPIDYVGDDADDQDIALPDAPEDASWGDNSWGDSTPQRGSKRPKAGSGVQKRRKKRRGRDEPSVQATGDDEASAPDNQSGVTVKRGVSRTKKPRPSSPQAPASPAGGVTGLASRLIGGGKDKSSSQVSHLIPTIGRKIGGPAVISVIGTGGKTTNAVGLGHILAEERPGRVIVVDATAEGGTLGDLVVREQGTTVDDLLQNLDTITEYRHIREFTSLSPSGLEFLVSDPNVIDIPDVTGEYLDLMMSVLRQHYDIIILATGSGIRDDLHAEALRQADHLVLVTAGASGMRKGTWTLNQLNSAGGHYHGEHTRLVDGMTAIVNDIFPKSSVDSTAIAGHFSGIAHETVITPFDPAVEGGAPINPDAVSAPLRNAWTKAAASLIDTIAAERNPR